MGFYNPAVITLLLCLVPGKLKIYQASPKSYDFGLLGKVNYLLNTSLAIDNICNHFIQLKTKPIQFCLQFKFIAMYYNIEY